MMMRFLLPLLLLLPVRVIQSSSNPYLSSLERFQYSNRLVLSNHQDAGCGVAWEIHNDVLHLALSMPLSQSLWMGFGWSESGGMLGSDMVVVQQQHHDDDDTNTTVTVTDYHVLDQHVQPLVDDCQDWLLMNVTYVTVDDETFAADDDMGWWWNTDDDDTMSNEFVVVHLQRHVDTGDAQDWSLPDDRDMPPTRVFCAWGSSETLSYHTGVAQGSLRFYDKGDGATAVATTTTTLDDIHDSSFFTIAADRYRIPQQETDYALFCVSVDDLINQGVDTTEGVTVTTFAPIIDNAAHVHHLAVLASTNDNNQGTCNQADYRDITYTWAPGDPPLVLPSHVGLQVAGAGGYRSFMLEIHYDNPDLVRNVRDNSGVRYYYTTQPRAFEMGVFALGDAWIRQTGQSVGRGSAVAHSYTCDTACSSLALSEPVTVLREYHHMHETGATLSARQYNANGALVRESVTQYFDFKQQGSQVVQQEEYQIRPGDAMELQCTYHTPEENRNFGISSREEMCIQYLVYYPRQTLNSPTYPDALGWMCIYEMDQLFGIPECDASHRDLGDVGDSSFRTFGQPSEQCEALPEQPSSMPSAAPTTWSSPSPSDAPSLLHSSAPSHLPSSLPSIAKTGEPTHPPSSWPTYPNELEVGSEHLVPLDSVLLTFVRGSPSSSRRELSTEAGWLLNDRTRTKELVFVTSHHLMDQIPQLMATDLHFTRVFTPSTDEYQETVALSGNLFFVVMSQEDNLAEMLSPNTVRRHVKEAFNDPYARGLYVKRVQLAVPSMTSMMSVYTGFPTSSHQTESEERVFWLDWEEPLWLVFVACSGLTCLGMPILMCYVCWKCCHRRKRRRLEISGDMTANESSDEAALTTPPSKRSKGRPFVDTGVETPETLDLDETSEEDKSSDDHSDEDPENVKTPNAAVDSPLKSSESSPKSPRDVPKPTESTSVDSFVSTSQIMKRKRSARRRLSMESIPEGKYGFSVKPPPSPSPFRPAGALNSTSPDGESSKSTCSSPVV